MANTLQMLINLDVAMSNGWDVKFRGLESGLERLRKASGELQAQTGKIGEFQKLAGALDANKNKLEVLRAQMQRNSINLNESREKTARLSSEYDKAKARLAALSQQYKPHSAIVQTAKRQVKELDEQYKASANETKKLEQRQAELYKAIGQADAKVDEETKSLNAMQKALSDAGIKTNDLTGQQEKLTQAQNRLNQARAKLANIKENLNWANIKGDILQSAGYLMMLRQPVKIDMEFEQAMANVRAVMNPTIQEFEQLREQALELGRTTQFSASQAAASQENLARAGFQQKQILNTMPALLAMSAAEGMDLAQGATILSGALQGFDLDASNASRLADAFAFTSASSATAISNLGEAFKVAAGTSAKLGVSPEKLLSYLGVLGNRQVLGTQAGSTITNALNRIADPKIAKKFQELGVAVSTKNGKMVELPEILRQFNEKTEAKGEVFQVAKLKEIFGAGYGKFMAGFMSEVISGNQTKLESGLVNEKTGAAQRMANVRNDTLKGDLTALSSAWEGLNIAVGAPLQDSIRNIVQGLTTGLSLITDFIEKNKALMEPVIKLAAGFAAWQVISTVYKYGKLIISLPFAKLNVLLAEQAAQAALTGENFSLLSSFMNTLLHPVSALKNAFSLLWGVVAAHPFMSLIAVASALYFYWDDIYALWQKTLNWLSEKWQGLTSLWENFQFPNIFQPLISFFDDVANYLKTGWQNLCNWFSSLNPFKNFSVPKIDAQTQQKAAAKARTSNVTPDFSSLTGFATGGIIEKHSYIQVAENGPEAIIPLNNKSRGVPLLMQAAQKLGVNSEFMAQADSLQQSNSQISQYRDFNQVYNNQAQSIIFPDNANSQFNSRSPLNFNIYVTGDNNLAENIAAKIRSVLDNLNEYEERVAYA